MDQPKKRTRRTKRSAKQICAAIAGCRGIRGIAIRKLGVTRGTFGTYLRRFPTAAEAFAEERELRKDSYEIVIDNEIVTGKNAKLALDTLDRIGRDRGYGRPTEPGPAQPADQEPPKWTEVGWKQDQEDPTEARKTRERLADLQLPHGLTLTSLGVPPGEEDEE